MPAKQHSPHINGVVEGFYSKPLPLWTDEERLTTIRFVHEFAPELNAYLYCPKHDPYVNERWDEPYPEQQLAPVRNVIAAARELNFRFIFGLNPALPEPGANLQTTADLWVLKVKHKLSQMMLAGCSSFCLLFDDVPLSFDAIDKVLGEESNQAEIFLVQLVNAVYRELHEQLEELWLCSPDYCFYHETGLTKALKELDPAIGVIWTGNGVFVRTFFMTDLERVRALLRPDVKLIYWSNYPVNDAEQNLGVLNLGGAFPPPDRTSETSLQRCS